MRSHITVMISTTHLIAFLLLLTPCLSQNCFANCSACLNMNTCTTCADGYGYTYGLGTASCTKCTDNCKVCIGTIGCAQCLDGYELSTTSDAVITCKSTSKVGLIIGIVVGVLVLIGIVVLVIYIVNKRKNNVVMMANTTLNTVQMAQPGNPNNMSLVSNVGQPQPQPQQPGVMQMRVGKK